jgi:hypothetical protein
LGSSEKNKTAATLAETSRKVGKEGEPSAQPHTLKNNNPKKAWNEGEMGSSSQVITCRRVTLQRERKKIVERLFFNKSVTVE